MLTKVLVTSKIENINAIIVSTWKILNVQTTNKLQLLCVYDNVLL